ncbi:MAG: DNA-processing protein DprA [Burkholderiaceae bacterium]|jgi:DNA processing protein|nr:DNA-processing protein DprA [Burkholderiaceae bacterium]
MHDRVPRDEDLAAWLRLTLTPGVGNDAARRLLAAFGWPTAIFGQSAAALRQVVSNAQTSALLAEPPDFAAKLQAAHDWLVQAPDDSGAIARVLVPLGDARYPPSLLAIEDPPALLYLMGRIDWLDAHGWPQRSLAMVGARTPTPQGGQNARDFARAFAQGGVCVVSGMALGIDGAAHEGALSAADQAPPESLLTLAVVGTGIDRVYPRQHRDLAHRIAARGLIVSEYPIGTPPLPANFPKRNRLIAGLSQGALVVEAARQSGSLITARLASEQGKDVFAIPGSIHSPLSRGCHALIRQGAKLVETAQDVLEELRWPAGTPAALPDLPDLLDASDESASGAALAGSGTDGGEDAALLQALGADPVGLDALLARTGLDTATLQARLLTLELKGRVGRLPGGLFQRIGLG